MLFTTTATRKKESICVSLSMTGILCSIVYHPLGRTKICHLSNKINVTQWWKTGSKHKKNGFCCYLVFLKQYSLLQKHVKVTQGKVTRCTYLRRRSRISEQLDCSLISPSCCLVCREDFYMTQTFFFASYHLCDMEHVIEPPKVPSLLKTNGILLAQV